MIKTQNKSKILLTIIGILLVTNIAMVVFFVAKKDGGKRAKRPDRRTMIATFLKKEIGFDTVQLQQYDTLSLRHKAKMRSMFDSARITKDKQFKELAASNFSDSMMNSIADRSAGAQKIMELQMFNHLKNVRLLCKPDQLPKFDSLFVKMLSRRNAEGRRNGSDSANKHKHN